MEFKIGDKVVKNPYTWIPSEFDAWGAGEGVGEIIKPPFELDEGYVDVKWPNGRCFQQTIELLPVLGIRKENCEYIRYNLWCNYTWIYDCHLNCVDGYTCYVYGSNLYSIQFPTQ